MQQHNKDSDTHAEAENAHFWQNVTGGGPEIRARLKYSREKIYNIIT